MTASIDAGYSFESNHISPQLLHFEDWNPTVPLLLGHDSQNPSSNFSEAPHMRVRLVLDRVDKKLPSENVTDRGRSLASITSSIVSNDGLMIVVSASGANS